MSDYEILGHNETESTAMIFLRFLAKMLVSIAFLGVIAVLTAELAGLSMNYAFAIGSVIAVLIFLMVDSKSGQEAMDTTMRSLTMKMKIRKRR